jgi:hypothetical protein
MTDLARGARARRGGRRPGWVLLTALLVLAIGASSALVFTNQVELLKLAVILALWAAVVAAFVSVIYRRQSDVDQARARDLKLVYDLQLDREISARREYELTVESQLRRELATELRAQANDEVSELRAELAALRTNLEILFDAELSDRPALEGERKAVRGYSEWERDDESARERVNRVSSVRAEEPRRPDDNSIIDVHEEPLAPNPPRQATAENHQQPSAPQPPKAYPPSRQNPVPEAPEPERGSHRRTSDQDTRTARPEPAPVAGWTPPNPPPAPASPVERQDGPSWTQPQPQGQPSGWTPPGPAPRTGPERFEPAPPPRRSHRRAEAPAQPEPQFAPPPPPPPQQPQPQRIAWPPPAEESRQPEQPATWQPVSSDGQWLPPEAPGSNWNAGQAESPSAPSWAYDNAPSRDKPSHRSPGIDEPDAERSAERQGRHTSAPAESAPRQSGEPGADDWSESDRGARSRHSAEQSDPAGAAAPPPAMSPAPSPPPPPPPSVPDREPVMSPPPPASARHRSTDALAESQEPQSGGQSVAELLARLQNAPSEGGRRRRRED